MALVQNVDHKPLMLTGGKTLEVGQTANVDLGASNEAALYAAGSLYLLDGTVSPPTPPAVHGVSYFDDTTGGATLPNGTSGNVLTSTGPSTPPSWLPPAGADLSGIQAQIDTISLSGKWKQPVKAASIVNQSLTAAGSRTVDGYSCASGDRVLLNAQTAGAENGIYTVGSDFSLTRATDANTTAKLTGAAVRVEVGTTNAEKLFLLVTDNFTLGTTALTWTPLSGGSGAASGTTFTPAGTVAATDVQAAIVEVAGEAAQKSANLSDLSDAGSSRANIHVPILGAVQACATGNVALTGTQTIDGIALAAGDRVLLTGQTTASQNGPWVVAAGAWSRPTDFPSAQVIKSRQVKVLGGTVNAGRDFYLSSGSYTIDTTSQTWNQAASVSPASVTTLGTVKLASAPADSANPIVVGDNDNRLSAPPRIVTTPRVGRTLYLDPTNPSQTEQQFDIGPMSVHTWTMTGTPTGGSTIATVNGVPLTVLYNSTAAQLQTLLDTVFGRNEGVVTGGPWPGTALVVTWQGLKTLALRQPVPTFNNAGLTGGSTPAASVAETQTSHPFTYTTDPSESSRPALTIATSRQGYIRTKPEYNFRNSETNLRFRAPTALHPSSVLRILARYLNEQNYQGLDKGFGGGLTFGYGLANNGSYVGARNISQIDVNAGVWRLKLERYGRRYRAKCWPEDIRTGVQTITIGGSPTGGTFTLTYGGQTATGIPYNETAANVQTALRALSSIGAGNVNVTGSAGGPYTITFAGTLASKPVTAFTGSAAGLTGGTPTLTQAWTTYGSDGTQPDWQIVGEGPNGPANFDAELGVNGLSALVYTAGVYITELTVTELEPVGDSIAANGDFTKLDNVSGTPLGWTGFGTIGTAVTETVLIPGPDGATRRFAHMFRDTDNSNQAIIHQSIYLRNRGLRGPSATTGRQLSESTEFPGAVEVGVTSKANNVRHLTAGGDFLSAAIVIYYNDERDNNINIGRPDYYGGFGPLGIVGGNDGTLVGTGGAGTWNWRRDVIRIPLPFPGRVDLLNLSIGLHDNDAGGDLWIGDVTVRLVA